MKLRTKEESIFVALAFLTAVGQLTWVQMAYNDPSVPSAWTGRQWAIIGGISLVFVTAQTLIAWKAFLHDPAKQDPRDLLPHAGPGAAPPKPPPTTTTPVKP